MKYFLIYRRTENERGQKKIKNVDFTDLKLMKTFCMFNNSARQSLWVETGAFSWRVGGCKFFLLCGFRTMRLATVSTRVPFQLGRFNRFNSGTLLGFFQIFEKILSGRHSSTFTQRQICRGNVSLINHEVPGNMMGRLFDSDNSGLPVHNFPNERGSAWSPRYLCR